MKKSTASTWDSHARILTTELQGEVTADDVREWIGLLENTLQRIPASSEFGLLQNLYGFNPVDLEAHKLMRDVIPLALAGHGMRPAFADWFDPSMPEDLPATRDCRCVAFANVHHDEVKMARYEQEISKPNQRFFTDTDTANGWLKTLLG